MGLLSRFGRGLTQAAPIFGQMAQASLLQAAEDKKYNRLIDREEKTWERKMEFETGKQTKALASARRKEKLDFINTGLTLNGSRIKMETDLIGRLTVNENTAMNPMNKELIRGEIVDARARLADAIARKNRLTALYQSYVDPTGELGVFSEAEEKRILTDVSIMNAASIAKDEILGYEGMATEDLDADVGMLDVDRATNLENKDSIVDAQLKSIDESLAGTTEKLNDKQKKLFRDTVESYIAERQAAYGPTSQMSDEQIASVLERRPVPATKEEKPAIYAGISPGSIGVNPSAFPELGEKIASGVRTVAEAVPWLAWKGGVGGKPRGKRLLKAVEDGVSDDSIAKILEIDKKDALRNLNSIISREFEESTYQATTVLGAIMALLNAGWDVERVINEIKSAEELQDETSFNTPNVEDSIAMMFNMSQRV